MLTYKAQYLFIKFFFSLNYLRAPVLKDQTPD